MYSLFGGLVPGSSGGTGWFILLYGAANLFSSLVFVCLFVCLFFSVSSTGDPVLSPTVGLEQVYLNDSKNSTRELLNLKNSFSEVTGYKLNSNKSVAFLYAKDKQAEKEIRETTPFSRDTNNIK